MSKRIEFIVSEEFYEKLDLMCQQKSTYSNEYILELIHKDMAVFFKKDDQDERIRKSWCIEKKISNNSLIEISVSHTFPLAY
jgi:hypothetical protein